MSYGGYLVCALQTQMMLVRKDSKRSHLNVAACILKEEEANVYVLYIHSIAFCLTLT